MPEHDLQFLRRSIELAASARRRGDNPFGAVLVDGGGAIVLEAENTVHTDGDLTGHAETNLVREATRRFTPEELEHCTLYASTEPCPMCAGAIFWSGIGRLVFALSSERYYESRDEDVRQLRLSSREVLRHGNRRIEVLGPLLEDEGLTVFFGG
ncbi:MAG TPA: nucleoside deaminase [Candidatus Sulfomarinibacteraceae bacterium]|nr:nucleoside deaminase [Candidatus Sulfomarinibacteraceae bacterium]